MKTISIFGFRGAGTEQDLKDFPDLPIDVVAGHMGYSFDGGNTIWGFGPISTLSAYDLMVALINGEGFPGKVTNDTYIFDLIRNGKSVVARDGTIQSVYEIKIDVDEGKFKQIEVNHKGMLDRDAMSPLKVPLYAFPSNTVNVYNCVTYLKLIGIPLPDLSGNMRDIKI